MKRLVLVALFLSAWLPAQETPLVITQPNGNYVAVINPSAGIVTVYAVDGNILTSKSSVNFLLEFELYQKVLIGKRGEQWFSALETGSTNNLPTTADLLASRAFPAEPTAAEAAAGTLAYRKRAYNTEAEFWGKDLPYDGVVRGAFAARTLMLAIPCRHVLMLYEIVSETLELRAWRNYGGELYVPQVYNSIPTPQELIAQLPADIVAERRKEIQLQMESLGPAAGNTLPLQISDVWVGAGGEDRYAVFDAANKHIMSYEWNGKALQLRSVRNMEVDLLIPSSFRSAPDQQALFEQLRKDRVRGQWLADNGYVLDMIELKSLADSKKASGGGKISPVQANMEKEDVIINFSDQRKVFVYRLIGAGNNLELISSRDDTLDLGVAVLDSLRMEQAYAVKQLAALKDQCNQHNTPLAMLTLRTMLKLDPRLYKEVEKTPQIQRELKKEEEYPKIIEEAIKAAQAEQAAKELRIKAAQAARDAKKKGP